ncbi:restriction endonuclease [uncultured Neglectibacter sp.]|uniref:restriction endonuclease n=1 Tax=uncultured Neglectibacter sp. TaxID=1924108 RepID=UPI0034E02D26
MLNTSKGKKFESIVKEICNELAKNERINAKVEERVPMIGDDGASHEIDVLYSFEHLGVNYRVAIECKNWEKPINVGELRNFCYKLEHIGNINGIFISAQSEFQDGAEKVSNFNGIKLVKYDELQKLLDGHNYKYLIPDYEIIGDPFWMCLNLNGKNLLEQNSFVEEGIFLFENKYFAEQFQENCLSVYHRNIKIVGVSQSHLKKIKSLKEQHKVSVKLFNQFTSDFNKKPYHFWDLDVRDIEMYIR